ncbi:hypothetical protein B0T19DRAFT_437413 [Cercophora scortea]|uniref:Uncharacterized protein n=1 Tax=Cercophora scortea TaxID=314031 RepID=A0AAE0MM36_9PEZI|nr:hypothetical protein B0T19DRAFT_437413 [Cercophora scortea]
MSYPYFQPGMDGTPVGHHHLGPVHLQPYQQQGHFLSPPGQQDRQLAQRHLPPPPQMQPFTMTPRAASLQPVARNFSDWPPDGNPIREGQLETPTKSGPPKGSRFAHQAPGAKVLAPILPVDAAVQNMAASSSDPVSQETRQDQELDEEDHGTVIRRKPRQNPGLPTQWVDRSYSAGPSDQTTKEMPPEAFGSEAQPQDGPAHSVDKKKWKSKSKKKKNQSNNQSTPNSDAAIASLSHPHAARDKGKQAEAAPDVAPGIGSDKNRKDGIKAAASRPTTPADLNSNFRAQKNNGPKAASKSDAKPKGQEEGTRVSASRPSTPIDSVDNLRPAQGHEADAKDDTTPKAPSRAVDKNTDNDATPRAPAQVVNRDTSDDPALKAPAQVLDQNQPKKKGRNNRNKKGNKSGNDPSVTAENATDLPSNEPLQSLDSRDTSPDREQHPRLSADQSYRAQAGGSLRVSRNRSKGPSSKGPFATNETVTKDSEDKEPPVEVAENPTAAVSSLATSAKQAEKDVEQPSDSKKEVTLAEQSIHGSFKNLPKQFNAWPRQRDGKIWVPPPLTIPPRATTPKVVVEHVEDVKQRDTSAAMDSDGLQFGSKKPSASSATLSHRTSDYFSTKSSFSRENSPPAADELKFESPLQSPERSAPSHSSSPKDSPRAPSRASSSTPSSSTMTHIPSPVDGNGSPAKSVAIRAQSAGTTPQKQSNTVSRAKSQPSSPMGRRG